MKNSELFEKVIKYYRNSFTVSEFDEFKTEISEFFVENKSLANNAILKLLDDKFHHLQFKDRILIRSHITKISKDVSTIKTIVVIYFVCSLLAALIFLFS